MALQGTTGRARKRSRSSSRRRKGGSKLRMLILLLVVTLLSCYAVEYMSLDRFLLIKTTVASQTKYLDQSRAQAICDSLFLNRKIYSGFMQEKEALESSQYVNKVKLIRRFPNHLQVILTEREPVALVNMGHLIPVDQNGVFLPIEPSEFGIELPILTISNRTITERTGGTDSKTMLDKNGRQLLDALLEFKRNKPELIDQISEFVLEESGKVAVITVDGPIKVVLGKWVNKDNMKYLEWMLAQVKDLNNKPSFVDISFEGQIIVKETEDI